MAASADGVCDVATVRSKSPGPMCQNPSAVSDVPMPPVLGSEPGMDLEEFASTMLGTDVAVAVIAARTIA